ncbi:MAG: hypothetical protein PHO10_11095 [Gemmiger sp.]|nr:hypothetical protein [Gemmiger sp.]
MEPTEQQTIPETAAPESAPATTFLDAGAPGPCPAKQHPVLRVKRACLANFARFAQFSRFGPANTPAPAPQALSTGDAPPTALRNVLRFFALMLVLTLVARGTAGATMPVVSLCSPASGTITQGVAVNGTVQREGGQALPLPEGLEVESLAVQRGQTLHEGEVLATFSTRDIAAQLAAKNAALQKQRAALAAGSLPVTADAYALDKAQTDLARAQEDDRRAEAAQQALVEAAQAQQIAALAAQQAAEEALNALVQQEAPADEDALAAANEQLARAKEAATAATQGVAAAIQTMDDTLLGTARATENAQSALAQAQADYEKAQASAAVTAQSNQADAALVQLEIDRLEGEIAQLTALQQQDGKLLSPSSAAVLACTLTPGQKTGEGGATLRLTDATSRTLAAFTLPQEKARLLTPGQSVAVQHETTSLAATVQSVVYTGDAAGGVAGSAGGETAQVLAALPQEEAGAWPLGQPLKIEITFSQATYDCCLPASAVRQDSTGRYVLVVAQTQTAFGVTNTATRVPVTVLEVSSDGATAAVLGSFAGKIITESDRTVAPGAAVRVQA